jgi:hypothetical protein
MTAMLPVASPSSAVTVIAVRLFSDDRADSGARAYAWIRR